MLDLNNCVDTSLDHSYHNSMSNWIKTSEKCRKKIFSKLFSTGTLKGLTVKSFTGCSMAVLPRLCSCELKWVEPVIQSKASTWSAVNFKTIGNLDEF